MLQRVQIERKCPCAAPARGLREALIVAGTLLALAAAAGAQTPAPDGGALFKEDCANCHNGSVDRAPDPSALRLMAPQRVLQALEFGSVVWRRHGRTAG